MRNPHTLLHGLPLVMLTVLNGCVSQRPLPVECPQFQASAQALQPIKAPNWKDLIRRLPQETWPMPSTQEQN